MDVDSLIAERDENEVRKEFTPSERLSIAREIEARLGSRQGKRTDKGYAGSLIGNPDAERVNGTSGQLPGSSLSPTSGEETRDFAAKKAGFPSTTQMRRVEEVVSTGTPELVEAMDAGEIAVSAAAKVAKEAPAKQQKAVKEAKAKDTWTPANVPAWRWRLSCCWRRGRRSGTSSANYVQSWQIITDTSSMNLQRLQIHTKTIAISRITKASRLLTGTTTQLPNQRRLGATTPKATTQGNNGHAREELSSDDSSDNNDSNIQNAVYVSA